MNLIDLTANKMAVYIHSQVEHSSSVAVLKYSLIIVINFFIVAFTTLLVCFFTGNVEKGIIALLCVPLLRYFSGGIHLKSAAACSLVTSLLILIAIHLQYSYIYSGVVLTLLSALILLFYAPQGILNVSSIDPKYYPLLKTISILIVSVNFYFESSFLASVFFLQSLTTLNAAQKFVDHYNI